MLAPPAWALSRDALWLGTGMRSTAAGVSGFFPNTWQATQLRRNLKA
jgi:hypothetical protein